MIKRFERQLTLGGGGKKHIIVIFVNNRGFPESDFSQQILSFRLELRFLEFSLLDALSIAGPALTGIGL